MVDKLKESRRKSKLKENDNLDEADAAAMDWESLPQPRTPKPRVIANVQLAPPRNLNTPSKQNKSEPVGKEVGNSRVASKGTKKEKDSGWSASSRKNRRRERLKSDPGNPGNNPARPQPKEDKKSSGAKGAGLNRKPPKTAAVSITGRSEDFSYRDALMRARKEISLSDLGIERTRVRRAANGGYLIEILDTDGEDKAKTLLAKLRALLPEEQAIIARPVTSGELRFIGLDDTILVEEAVRIIALEGKCDIEEVKVGSIQPMRNGLYTV